MLKHSGKFLLILVAAAGGCNRSDRVAENRRPASVLPDSTQAVLPLTPAPKVLLPEKKDSISVEGAYQPMTLRLFEGGSTLPFYTYVPGDMIAKRDSSAQGERYRFTANFGGKRSDNAFLEIFIFPALMNRDSILAFSKQVRESHLTKGFTSMFDLRMHGQRYYYIAEYYPAEYGDGFGPRAQRILNEWQWVDATSPPRP